ncbi:Hypothetical protein SRAE_X000058600 [Strongyloides ratti]|uniref:Uncharacterized protein n=1 Tax=Strongyloides ratti TaxID=34506 RepID=A0A090LUH2_STRRB|nr:Hypothetical protein SRAE_X000058600 [Strongyloides ratti]CEF71259.1 Hypothetical protein SRAE_X000058600 [Strongyloides ratti]
MTITCCCPSEGIYYTNPNKLCNRDSIYGGKIYGEKSIDQKDNNSNQVLTPSLVRWKYYPLTSIDPGNFKRHYGKLKIKK